jgi:hypothetical protein
MTLPEVMIAMTVFIIAVGGFLTVHLFGLRLNEFVKAKLGASDEARRSMARMVGEIRTAGLIRVGTGGVGDFQEAAFGEAQRGNALQLYSDKTLSNHFIRYFCDPNDGRLKRTEDGSTAVLVLAHAISEPVIFTSEDYLGNVLTNPMNNRVIGLDLHFLQLVDPTIKIGEGGLFDSYRLRTKITRRALE